MKPDEHLHIKAELTTADHQAALKLLRNMAEWIDHHAAHPDMPVNADWSSVDGSASIQIKTRKDRFNGQETNSD